MIDKPKFKDCFSIEILESDHVVLLGEDGHKVLSGRAYKNLAPWLDGQHTLIDIAEKLQGKLSLPAIQYTLNRLETQGCIVEANGTPTARTSFFYALGTNPESALKRLSQTNVSVTTLGSSTDTTLLAALANEGIHLTDNDSDLQVVLVDDYLQPGLKEINKAALLSGKPWIIAKLEGSQSWFGPIFYPGQTACWACLAQRLRANRQVESFVLRRNNQEGPIKTSFAFLPSTIETAVNLLITEMVKFVIQGHNSRLENQLLTYNHLNMELKTHFVAKRPQCSACGEPQQFAKPKAITLTNNTQKSTTPGLRSCPPEVTFKRFQHHISPLTGIITDMRDMTSDNDDLIYVYAAGHYFPLIVDSIFWLRQNVKALSGGKGATRIQSKVSAMGEAIERYSCIYWGHEPLVRGCYLDLQEQAVHPNEILNISDHQYANREEWNKEQLGRSYQIIPNRFTEDKEVDWTPVWSLTEQSFKYILSTLCYYGHPEERHFFNTIDSNGVAAGNSLEEALLQGFLELVERDSVALWWYNRASRPGVDLSSFNIPYLNSLQQRYHMLERDIWVLDITSDLNIPAFAALSRWKDAPTEDIIYGFSAHLDPETALMQAITEMNQCLPAIRFNADGKGGYRWPHGEATAWWQEATIDNQPYLWPEALPHKTRADYTNLLHHDLKTSIEQCVEIVKTAGMEMFALDMTQPDIGMNVCRVIVPGMRHFWRRLGPGRLYDMPLQLDWLEHAVAEEDMNPYSIFF